MMKKIDECEICGNTLFTSKFKGFDKLIGITGEFKIVECNYCGVQFINPQPSYKELSKYYDNKKYYSLKRIDKNSYKTKLKLFLYKLYFIKNKRYLLKILFSPIKFMIRTVIIEKDKKLLDIGCGSGQFLYEMKQLGLDVSGIENGILDKELADNLRIQNKDLISAKYPSNYFDVITINHVLEHLNNPTATIREIYRILNQDGKLIIGIPNTNSLANKLFNKNWLAYDVPRHLFNYSDKLLIGFLKKNKFKIKKIRYNSRPSQFVMSFYFMFGIQNKNKGFNKFLELLFIPLTLLVNLIKIGDQVEILCTK